MQNLRVFCIFYPRRAARRTLQNQLQLRALFDGKDVHMADNLWTASFRKAKLAPDEDGVSVEETLLDHGTFFYLSDRFLKGGSELVVKDLIGSFKKCETVEEAIAAMEDTSMSSPVIAATAPKAASASATESAVALGPHSASGR